MSQSINPDFHAKPKGLLSVDEYVKGILCGDRVVLARAITLIESSRSDHQEIARRVVSDCLPHAGNSIRIGITGVPGVGKSSFIEASGSCLLDDHQKKVAVLAIDPSSSRQGGSILGDKTRMEKLSVDHRVFIRPSPTSGSLGGVAQKTRETVLLCEAAGYDLILIETVGVGQSEIAVYDMVDCFVLLMLAGAGDQLQGIKRGIMEMADLVAITKADGDNKINADLARSEYDSAVRLLPSQDHKLTRSVLTCSSETGNGVDRVWNAIFEFANAIQSNGFKKENRQKQACQWMKQALETQILGSFYTNEKAVSIYKKFEKEVRNNQKSPFEAAHELFDIYLKGF